MHKNRVIDPKQCPECHGKRVIQAGEMRDGRQPMYCPTCRTQYELLMEVEGAIVEGREFRNAKQYTPVDDTQEIQWFEIKDRTGRRATLRCPGCGDYYSSLYTLAAIPEDAVCDPEARCWGCAGVNEWYSLEEENYLRPRNVVIDIPVVWK